MSTNLHTRPCLAQPNGMSVQIEGFFHASTGTWTYVVHDGVDAVVIDPVLDYDHKSGAIYVESIALVRNYLETHDLKLRRILETHAHADHLSGAQLIRDDDDVSIGIGEGIRDVQRYFGEVFEFDDAMLHGVFDEQYRDGDVIEAGSLRFEVLATPGHTSDSLSYRIGENVFIGDTLFAPDVGTARCDFPGGSVEQLYESIQKLYGLGDDVILWLCHDYPVAGREPISHITVRESKLSNKMLSAFDTLDDFAERRRARDATLPAPNLLYPSLQVNIRGGRLPAPTADGRVYLRTPIRIDV